MKKSILFIAFSIILFSFDVPKGWIKAGSEPKKYEMSVEKGAGQDGKNAATIKSIDKKISGFGTLMQNCLPDKYLGKRVKMSGYIKSKDVVNWAGLWFRVDEKDSKKPLAFDNMKDRSIKGTTEWQKYEIVLDVPANSSNLAYGALLGGTGQIWFDNLKFEIVDESTPVTGQKPSEPQNLNFEEE